MIPLTAILAFMLTPDWPLTDEDLDLYAYRPVEEISEDLSIEDLEFEIIYKDTLKKLETIYPHLGADND